MAENKFTFLPKTMQAVGRVFAQIWQRTTFTINTITHGGPTVSWFGPVRYAELWGKVRAEDSSIVVAAVRWIQRTFTEAPPQIAEWLPAKEEWRYHPMDEPILELLERPNPFYTGGTLWKATLADRIFSGISYWLKVRAPDRKVVQLWWAPAATMTPIQDNPKDYITYFEYRPLGATSGPYYLDPRDVVRFPDGVDPDDPKLGLSPVRTLLRELYTDEQAAIMTAALLKNMGVPGIVIAPKAQLSREAAEAIKSRTMETTTGEHRGEPIVLEGGADIVSFGFNPQQLELRAIRGLPEERVTAVLGINAAVLGLGAGLETTKVGATLREYREEAFESSIIPLYRELGADLTLSLLPDFFAGTQLANRRVGFDLSAIRVLQQDEIDRAKMLGEQLGSGGILVSEYRRKLGYQVLPEHEVYLRSKNIDAVPSRAYKPDPREEATPAPAPAAPPPPAPAPSQNGNGSTPPAAQPVAVP